MRREGDVGEFSRNWARGAIAAILFTVFGCERDGGQSLVTPPVKELSAEVGAQGTCPPFPLRD